MTPSSTATAAGSPCPSTAARRCSWPPSASWTPAGVTVQDIGLRRPTLDDVFLTLTGHAAEDAQEEAAKKARKAGRKQSDPPPIRTRRSGPCRAREDEDEKEVASR